MAKKKQSEPTTVAQETTVAPETMSASTAEETVDLTNFTPDAPTGVTELVVEDSTTITEALPVVAETKTVEVETKLVPVVEEKTVAVDKEFLYRMLVGLSRGHTNYYTYAQVTGMIGKLFYVDGAEKQAKWDEIKEYIQKR